MMKRNMRLLSSLTGLLALGAGDALCAEKTDVEKRWNSFSYLSTDLPVTVYYYVPEGDAATMPVLFIMHGHGHGEDNPGRFCTQLANERKFIIVAPSFPGKYFDCAAYQFGGISSSYDSYQPLPEKQWNYQVIEAAFNKVKELTGNQSKTFDMSGHSGGGQFVHRYLLAMPNAPVGLAVAGNPGHWTFPTTDGRIDETGTVFDWPHTVRGSILENEERLRSFFARNLIVQLGDADTKPFEPEKYTDPRAQFMVAPGAMAEGKNRYERGMNFFRTAERVAREKGWKFNWKLVQVPGAGHDQVHMFYGIAWGQIDKKTPHMPQTRSYGAFRQIYNENREK